MTTLIEHPEALKAEATDPAEQLLCDFFDDIWARGNADAVGHYLASDFTFNPPPGYEPTREGYRKMVEDMHHAFPDLFGDLIGVVGAHGKAAAKWMMEGTHKGAWMGIPATGRKIHMEGLAMQKSRDGQIVKEYIAQDMMGFFEQLGVTDLKALQG